MKKPLLWISSGMVLGSLITAPVVAGAESLQVVLSQFKLMVNGTDKTPADGTFSNGTTQVPYMLNYEGTTYVPVKYLSEALGTSVQWDGPNQTIWIGNKPSGVTPPAQGTSAQPEANLPVTYTSVGAVLYDADGTNLLKVSVAIRNDDSNTFEFDRYQGEFVGSDGAKYSASMYVPQGYEFEVEPRTTRVIDFYTTLPKGLDPNSLKLQLTKPDFSVFPAQFKTWASLPINAIGDSNVGFNGLQTANFRLAPYNVELGPAASWSHNSMTSVQVYKIHTRTTKDANLNVYPNSTELIFELIDGDGESVGETRYTVGETSLTATPALKDQGDEYVTFNNVSWARYNNVGVKIKVYEAFKDGKRSIGEFAIKNN